MKKFLLFLLFLSSVLFSQTDSMYKKTPEIELPDFVITKISQIDLPVQTKETPEVINPFSSEFVLPRVGNENLSLEGLTDPMKVFAQIIDSIPNTDIRLMAGAGRYKLPCSEFFMQQLFDSRNKFYIAAKLDNQLAFKENSNYLNFLIEGGTSFIFKKYSDSPARISLYGGYERRLFSPFASLKDNSSRSINNITVKGKMENIFYREFDINLGGFANYQFYTSGINQFLQIKPFIEGKTDFEHFSLFVKGEPVLAKIFGDHSKWNFYFPVTGEMKLKKIADLFNLSAKLQFQNNDGLDKIYLGPSAKAEFLFNQNFSFSVFYQNNLNLFTPVELLCANPYTDTSAFSYNLEKTENKIGFGSTIHFDRFNNIEIVFSMYDLVNFHTFGLSPNSGFFNVSYSNLSAKEIKAFINLSIDQTEVINGEIKWQSIKYKSESLKVPFYPEFVVNLNYTHNFNFLLYLGLRISYNYNLFADSLNKIEIPARVNLSLFTEYYLSKTLVLGLEANNLLNKENVFWFNYPEKPLDIFGYIKLNL